MTTTEKLATQLGLRPQSIRARLCRTGSYYGVTPEKLPNGRLIWPEDARDRLISSKRGGEK